MEHITFMDKIRIFLGIRQEPPSNDFRNPIWGSDDDDDDDELFTRSQMNTHTDPAELEREFASQMQEMFKSFGSIFGDMKSFFQEEHFDTIGTNTGYQEPENLPGSSIRDYYLKPGYLNKKQDSPKDIDLDGKISSQEISGLFKQKEGSENADLAPFSGNMVPGRSFCKTIITTSVKKPDGSVETRKIIKNGNEVIEETTTSMGPDDLGPFSANIDPVAPITSSSFIYNHVMSELSTLFKNVH